MSEHATWRNLCFSHTRRVRSDYNNRARPLRGRSALLEARLERSVSGSDATLRYNLYLSQEGELTILERSAR